MKKAIVSLRNIVGTAGLLFIGYVCIKAIPDLGRYVKMSSM